MSSSCPRSRPSSRADTVLLSWLPPGYRGTELASLEPVTTECTWI